MMAGQRPQPGFKGSDTASRIGSKESSKKLDWRNSIAPSVILSAPPQPMDNFNKVVLSARRNNKLLIVALQPSASVLYLPIG
eukprot:941772-Pleurochrysis_carterae.AAC.1